MLQEFDLEIRDKKGVKNVAIDHMSRLENKEVTKKDKAIEVEFPNEQLFMVTERPWFMDMANFKAGNLIPEELTYQQKKKFFKEANSNVWDGPYLSRTNPDGLLHRWVASDEIKSIIWHCHSTTYGGHHSVERTATKVLQSGFWWPTLFKDGQEFFRQYDKCQRTGNISKSNEIPLNGILEVEPFDYLGIDFMGPFSSSYSDLYTLVCVDHVTKWVEPIACTANDAHNVVNFLMKNIFPKLRTPRVLSSDGGSTFATNT